MHFLSIAVKKNHTKLFVLSVSRNVRVCETVILNNTGNAFEERSIILYCIQIC